ncbi:hypothetical protein [Proteiniphilum sp. UBA5384]|uniref:hypothetical protein n=1 Tax=Proteiniphilum sp. UBA5384 TaxID=1947279 RepID=UPI0025F8CE05|nr:hypothetical protein [Proteiniphilum sp. UBA5384]
MKIETIKNKGFALSIILFPLMLLAGFVMHPDLIEMKMLHTAQDLVDRFHNNNLYHIGHFIVMMAVPLIIVVMVGTMNMLQGKGKRYAYWGGIIGIFGAFILAVDKGALCLVMSAFDTIPEPQFQGLIPYLDVIVKKAGLLWIVYFLPLLPLGAIIQTIGLLKEKVVFKWEGFLIIIGLALLNNPEIELISTIGSVLMCMGYISWGVREFSRKQKS